MKKVYIIMLLALIVGINAKGQTINGAYLDINNVKALINADGMNFTPSTANPISYEVPKGGGKQTFSSNCLWVGGYDAGGQLHVAAGTYRQTGRDFYQGPYDTSGTYGTAYDNSWNRVWKVKRCDIQAHYYWYNWVQIGPDPFSTDSAALEAVVNWPAFDINGQPLAPFYDYNGDGQYDFSSGDFPLIKGDEAIFFVYNDDRGNHTETGGDKIGLQIQGMAYAYNCTNDSALNNTIFMNYKVINKSNARLDSAFIGNWSDIDLGYAFDDYVGCDVAKGDYFQYNATAVDGSGQAYAYGANPPAQGVVFLKGPLANPNGLDDAQNTVPASYQNYGDGVIDNEQLGMSRSMYYINSIGLNGNPVLADDYYQYLSGAWLTGQNWTYGGSGISATAASHYLFPGSSDPTGFGTNMIPKPPWDEFTSANNPGDRRTLGSFGPFNLEPGASETLDFAYVFGKAYQGGPLASVAEMKNRIDSVRTKFNSGLIGISWTPWNSGLFCSCASQTGINELSIESEISIFPNPSSGIYHISSNTLKIQTIKVMNLMSEEILQTAVNNKLTTIDLSGYSKGFYFVQITDENRNITNKKIIVE